MEHTCLYTKNHAGASGVLKEGLEGACVKTVYVARLRGSKILLFSRWEILIILWLDDYLLNSKISKTFKKYMNKKGY